MVTPLLNREIGILEFNSRVLSQAEDLQNPLLERLRFLSIVSKSLTVWKIGNSDLISNFCFLVYFFIYVGNKE